MNAIVKGVWRIQQFQSIEFLKFKVVVVRILGNGADMRSSKRRRHKGGSSLRWNLSEGEKMEEQLLDSASMVLCLTRAHTVYHCWIYILNIFIFKSQN